MIDKLYYSSLKISERWENALRVTMDNRINYEKLCYLMSQITTEIN